MAFNKAKALQEAEKSVIQGKISHAIRQYCDIFERDPSDLILLNTIGDLYIRDKNASEGLRLFYRLAGAYVQEGFTVKAIAIYKKIVKLEPDSVEPLLRLAELYQIQGLAREAREQYYQAAEYYKRRNLNDKVIEVLRRAVQLDVENTAAKARLAAFCEQAGLKDEATQAYLEIAQSAFQKGNTSVAQAALRKAQELDPNNHQVSLLRAREALATKHPEEVEGILCAVPGLKDDPAGSALLVESYLSTRQLEKAQELVLNLFRANPADFSPVASYVSVCVGARQFDPAFKALSGLADELVEQKNTGSLMESLRLIWSKAPEHLSTLELICRICDKTGDEFALPEILEALGHAYAKCGQLEKAEQVFQRLVNREPGNEQYNALLKQIFHKQGKDVVKAHAEDLADAEIALVPEEEEEAAPVRDAERDALVKESLGNSDLYARYRLLDKAVAELDKVLEIYPDEIEVHKRLTEMCWKGMPERAEEAARALVRIYTQRGDEAGAKRYRQLVGGQGAPAAKGAPDEVVPQREASPEPPAPLPAQPAAEAASGIAIAPEAPLAPAREKVAAPIPEGFAAGPAETLPDVLPLPEPGASVAPPAEADLSAPTAAEAPAAETPPLLLPAPAFEIQPPAGLLTPALSPEVEGVDLSEDWELAQAQTAVPAPPSPEAAQAESKFNYEESLTEIKFFLENGFPDEARRFVEELERELPGVQRISELRALVAAHSRAQADQASEAPEARAEKSGEAPPGPEKSSGAAGGAAAGLPGEMGEELEATLKGLPESSPSAPSSAPAAEMVSPFSELLEELGEGPREASAAEDDRETHYNLGVAFREMHLLDEAIGEFQKVVKGSGRGVYPPNYLRACTLLAICFLDKGMANLAVKWYLRALETPGLDEEAIMALHYDLGVAYEQAGDLRAAMDRFTEVYSQNIDFRDVAEKIRALQQKVT